MKNAEEDEMSVEESVIESLAANALAYRDGCAAPMWKHKEQASLVLGVLSRARYAVVKLPEKDAILPTLDEMAGLRYYFGTEKGRQMGAALLAAESVMQQLGITQDDLDNFVWGRKVTAESSVGDSDGDTVGALVDRAEAVAPGSIRWGGYVVTYLGQVDLKDWQVQP